MNGQVPAKRQEEEVPSPGRPEVGTTATEGGAGALQAARPGTPG